MESVRLCRGVRVSGRDARREDIDATVPAHTRALDAEGCHAVHGATLEVLEKTGVEVQHEEALALLRPPAPASTARACACPAALVDDALAAAPRSIALASRGATPGARARRPDPSTTAPAPTASSCSARGPRPPRRHPGRRGGDGGAAGEAAPTSTSSSRWSTRTSSPRAVAPAAQFAAMLRGTSKPLIMVPEDARHLELFNEMAAACGAADSWAHLRHADSAADARQRVGRTGSPAAHGSASP